MSIVDHKSVLRELTVQETMRRLVPHTPCQTPIEQVTRFMIKYKVNAVLVTDAQESGIGVVSKTDLMGAYYAEMPIETPVEALMTGPPLFCQPDDSLDKALEVMRSRGVHRLYVAGEMPAKAIGVLAYPDIVGILYRYCARCERSLSRRRGSRVELPLAELVKVHEVMTPSVHTHNDDETLYQVMEGLSAQRLGAALITSKAGAALGVISKTDLLLAYRHGVPASAAARTIMKSPVIGCAADEPLCLALQTMIFSDVQRLFVTGDDTNRVEGVLSLSDAARVRSGTCRACIATRLKVSGGP